MMRIKSFILPFLWIGILSLQISCRRHPAHHRLVSVSILPQKYLVERIAGDYLDINVMIPPGSNPVTCDLNTEKMKRLYDSDLCFTIGELPFEITHLYPAAGKLENLKMVNHSEQLRLSNDSCRNRSTPEHRQPKTDPHIWLSPSNFRQMALTVCTALSEYYPEQKETFKANYEKLCRDIDRIADEARQVFAGHSRQAFLIAHPALTCFAAEYDLEQISVKDEGKEPSPAHVKEIIDLARRKNIRKVFIQRQFDVSNAESVAKEIGGSIILIDPLAEDWLKEMHRLIDSFK